ncbi:MAG: GTPase [Nanobdellota archaeon]
MGFSKIPPLESPEQYVDNAFRKARLRAREYTLKDHEKSEIRRKKSLSKQKLDTIREYLTQKIEKLTTEFPSIDSLDEFYIQLIRIYLDEESVKRSLSVLSGLSQKTKQFSSSYQRKIMQSNSPVEVDKKMKEFYGRISSLFKRTTEVFTYLQEVRSTLQSFPELKKKHFTVCIAGFPNVGKSTLLSKLTTSTPMINSYPFTTKTLNVGYQHKEGITIQYIDTPGTLNRLEKQNSIEKQAEVTMRYAAQAIVFVFDITEESYPISKQFQLFKKIKRFHIPIIAYLSKTDILDQEQIVEFGKEFDNKKIPLLTNQEEIVDVLIQSYRDMVR